MPNLLVSQKLDLVRASLQTAVSHASLLRFAVDEDDVEGIMRYRECLHNALELVADEMGHIAQLLPDWRPASHCHAHQAQPDGNSNPLHNSDAHLGATES